MMLLVVSVVAALLAGALVVALLALHRRQHALARQIELLRGELAAASAHEPAGPVPAERRTPVPAPLPGPVPEPVPVVTDLAGRSVPAARAASLRVSASVAEPLISVLAFVHGLRAIADEETRMRVGYAFRKELRHQRRLRRHRVVGRSLHGWGAR